VSRNKTKTLRVDLTRIIVGSTRTGTVQLTTQRADSTCHRVASTGVWLNENKNNNEKKNKKLSTPLVPVDLL
jgi:hypothetical protein